MPSPLFYCAKEVRTTTAAGHESIEIQVEAQLAQELPEVDLREVQVVGGDGGTLKVVIDHPAGVTHELCVATTRSLDRVGLLDRFAIEVSSPGPEPPLRTLEHYRKAVGRRVSMRVADDGAPRARSVSGTLVAVEADGVALSTGDGTTRIPTGAIRRARIVGGNES